jgi:predicted  nucleic acid-binding Zn ribbon protein
MGWEQEMEKELAEAKAKIVTAGKQTYQAGKSYVKAEVIKIDKYYQNAANMIGDSYAQSSWAFMP